MIKIPGLACLQKNSPQTSYVFLHELKISTYTNTVYQGTLAKSGTSEFLAHTETLENTATSNLIGAFGLGFYSSFLVADRVHVASIPPKTSKNPEPAQYVFRSSADDTTFDIYPDPRGNTLGRGTEITLFMKPDTLEYLETSRLSALV
jgi:heat shock protein beta